MISQKVTVGPPLVLFLSVLLYNEPISGYICSRRLVGDYSLKCIDTINVTLSASLPKSLSAYLSIFRIKFNADYKIFLKARFLGRLE